MNDDSLRQVLPCLALVRNRAFHLLEVPHTYTSCFPYKLRIFVLFLQLLLHSKYKLFHLMLRTEHHLSSEICYLSILLSFLLFLQIHSYLFHQLYNLRLKIPYSIPALK